MRNFKKFKKYNIYSDSNPVGNDVYIDMSQAEAIEFEVHSPCGNKVNAGIYQIIHISMNESSYTVLNEGYDMESLFDK